MDLCLEDDPFEDVEWEKEDYEAYQGNWGPSATHWYSRSALVLVPRQNLGNYLVKCADRSNGSNPNADSALSYLAKLFSRPSAGPPMLDTMSKLCEKRSDDPLQPETNSILLKAAFQHSHHKIFENVAAHHQGYLPIEFFDWVQEWLSTLPDAERAEKQRTWIPPLIQGYPSVADRFKVIEKMGNSMGNTAVPDAASPNQSWAQSMVRDSISYLLQGTAIPNAADGDMIVSVIFNLNETWASTSALITSIFDRYPQAQAAAFLLALLSRLKTLAAAPNLPISEIMELCRSLSLRFFNDERTVSTIITRSTPETPSQAAPVVTPQALVQFASDLNDLSNNALDLLQPFIQQINTNCLEFLQKDMRYFWMPFLYQLIPALVSRSVSLNTPSYQQLTRLFVKRLDDILGPCPTAGPNARSPQVRCTCSDCAILNEFLRDSSRVVFRFKVAKLRRLHLAESLENDPSDCTHATERAGRPQTLIVTKLNTLQHQIDGWKKRQAALYRHIAKNIHQEHLQTLLGTDEATRIRSLGGL
ncbi:hypothetical protein PTTG_27784 [Puccinia triticina 1-1 BBBD Race 1]|uniref:Uncharacterized protein n=1 Tax=Puccinia triticina (isolate 1-1 / race 1 (BBBD)) TaxID=630390 RepID=A0A180GJF8_PUCT1|nr:hypothetical protein PTTG_27784 [Puccinia triticina 1-1 BBBD Race 1]